MKSKPEFSSERSILFLYLFNLISSCNTPSYYIYKKMNSYIKTEPVSQYYNFILDKKIITGLPIFTWCEIQGLFHDFPGPFQGNPGPSLSTKTWILYSFTEMDNPWQINDRSLWTKIMPCEVKVFVLQHCCIKTIITNSIFLLFLEIKTEIFLPIPGFSRTMT